MGKKRRYKKSGKLSIIFISIIISLGLLGVGYGYWTDSIKIVANITTGSGDLWVKVEGSDLNVNVSEDGKTITLGGQVHPDSLERLTILVGNAGSVPMVLDKIVEDNKSGITDLKKEGGPKYALLTKDIKNDVIETFSLSILPPKNEKEDTKKEAGGLSKKLSIEKTKSFEEKIQELKDRREFLEEETKDIENEIERLKVGEKHKFKYDLHFVQGI